jgi:hypothetical protein
MLILNPFDNFHDLSNPVYMYLQPVPARSVAVAPPSLASYNTLTNGIASDYSSFLVVEGSVCRHYHNQFSMYL